MARGFFFIVLSNRIRHNFWQNIVRFCRQATVTPFDNIQRSLVHSRKTRKTHNRLFKLVTIKKYIISNYVQVEKLLVLADGYLNITQLPVKNACRFSADS